MSARTGIQWTDATWNPIRGCSRVSPGCQHCYAEAVAARFSGPGQAYEGLARRRSNGEPQWTGEVRIIEKHMLDPLRWKSPRRIFVNSMSDLFHEKLSDEAIDRVFAVMALAPRHTFQVLTKRPERMREYFAYEHRGAQIEGALSEFAEFEDQPALAHADGWRPLPNVWLGTSVENQQCADERIPHLLATPAAVRFLSCEPLLGPIDLRQWLWDTFPVADENGEYDGTDIQFYDDLHWVIAGGESGAGARSCDLEWIRSIVDQCQTASVATFVKQLGRRPVAANDGECQEDWPGAYVPFADSFEPAFQGEIGPLRLADSHGADWEEWPADLRVREFPDRPIVRGRA